LYRDGNSSAVLEEARNIAKDAIEMQHCTFQPQLVSKDVVDKLASKRTQVEVHKRLFVEAKELERKREEVI
jgi:hypothetical protein